jgi:hypothetical protein
MDRKEVPGFYNSINRFIKGIILRMICIGLFICTVTSTRVIAQNSSFEFWPETDIWYRVSPSWRLSAFIPITKYHESKYRDLNIYLQADYAWGKTKHLHFGRLYNENRAEQMKAWMIRGGFMEGWSLGENAGAYRERMLFAEIHRRMPLGKKVLYSQRIRTDFRWVGQDPQFSYRIRYRVMVEKEFTSGHCSFVPYINAEPYWDSRYSTINRIRLIGGTTISWGPRFAVEANLTYQYDDHYDTRNLYAINMILHLFFESTRSKKAKAGS